MPNRLSLILEITDHNTLPFLSGKYYKIEMGTTVQGSNDIESGICTW